MRYVSKKKNQVIVRLSLVTFFVATIAIFTPWCLSIWLALVCFALPMIVFAVISMRVSGAKQARSVLVNFFYGEALKWAITIGLFFVVLVNPTELIRLDAFLLTYIGMVIIYPFLFIKV